jgi:hypothetical protein
LAASSQVHLQRLPALPLHDNAPLVLPPPSASHRSTSYLPLPKSNLLAQSFTYFFPTIVKSLGYNRTTTLLTVPVWFATLLATLGIAYHSSRTSERSLHIAACMLLGAVGNIVVGTTHSTGPRMFAMYLMPIGILPPFQMILAWITSSFPRPLGKTAVVVASCGIVGNAAGIYGSYMYPLSDGPQYVPAGAGLAGVCCLCAGIAIAIRFVLRWENDKLEKKEMEEGASRGFRYIL